MSQPPPPAGGLFPAEFPPPPRLPACLPRLPACPAAAAAAAAKGQPPPEYALLAFLKGVVVKSSFSVKCTMDDIR